MRKHRVTSLMLFMLGFAAGATFAAVTPSTGGTNQSGASPKPDAVKKAAGDAARTRPLQSPADQDAEEAARRRRAGKAGTPG